MAYGSNFMVHLLLKVPRKLAAATLGMPQLCAELRRPKPVLWNDCVAKIKRRRKGFEHMLGSSICSVRGTSLEKQSCVKEHYSQ